MSENQRGGGDRPKKSWRDVDAGRDRARPAASASPGGSRPEREDDRSSKQHRAALEALFAKGDFGKLAEKMATTSGLRGGAPTSTASSGAPADDAPSAPPVRPPVAPAPPPVDPSPRLSARKKILEAVGRDQITRAVDKYVAEFGWPSDYELLEQALDHTKEARQGEAMDALEKLLAKEKPRRSRTLSGKLRLLEETSHDDDVRTRAAALRQKLA